MFDALYADGPDVIVAGTFNPTGTATPVTGGYKVSGRWSFASGCQHAHWLLAHSIVDDGRVPPMQMMVLHPDDVQIIDTWSVSGLCGTGSHDFVADDVFVPADRTFSLFDEPSLDIALLRIPELSFSSLEIATAAIGIARGALERHRDAGHRQGTGLRGRAAGRQPAVPTPARRGRRPAARRPIARRR